MVGRGVGGGIRDLYACTFIGMCRLYHCVKGGRLVSEVHMHHQEHFKLYCIVSGRERGGGGGGGIRDLYTCTFIVLFRLCHCVNGDIRITCVPS